jgi:hypothetical protein
MLIGTSATLYVASLVYLFMSYFAYLLGDWHGERGKEVKDYIIIRLLFSIGFSLAATFLIVLVKL